jgi:penicillin-binding protein 1A
MIHMLKGTIEEPGGTSRGIERALKEGNEICGKTGTTSNQSDGWFVGMARGLCAGVWVGGEDRCIHFRTLGLGGGASTARPIWERFMLSIYEDRELPYEKGPLLDYTKPIGVDIPIQLENAKAVLPAQEEDQEEESMMEKDAVDVELDIDEIF